VSSRHHIASNSEHMQSHPQGKTCYAPAGCSHDHRQREPKWKQRKHKARPGRKNRPSGSSNDRRPRNTAERRLGKREWPGKTSSGVAAVADDAAVAVDDDDVHSPYEKRPSDKEHRPIRGECDGCNSCHMRRLRWCRSWNPTRYEREVTSNSMESQSQQRPRKRLQRRCWRRFERLGRRQRPHSLRQERGYDDEPAEMLEIYQGEIDFAHVNHPV